MSEAEDISYRDQVNALLRVAKHRPNLTVIILVGSVFAALLEGIGVSFILPIVEIVQSPSNPTANAEGPISIFITAYQIAGIPLTLGFAVAGVSLVLTVRWTTTFGTRWMLEYLVIDYIRETQKKLFDNALDAQVEYIDEEGSDDILNAIVTQTEYAGQSIKMVINFIEQGLLVLLYLLVAFILSPYLTLFALFFLGGFTIFFRFLFKPGYVLGDKVADANENIQQSAQAGIQGIRDTKLFGMKSEIFSDYKESIDEFANKSNILRRNETAINNFYNLLTAVSVFILIYLGVTFADLSLGALGVFLFAMFRLGPKASTLNAKVYQIENNLPHLIRTQEYIDELKKNSEITTASESVPDPVEDVAFDDVSFTYSGQDQEALSQISFELEKDDFIGFVGHSGAGKSTIVSLVTRMYEPDSGRITANGRPISKMDIDKWRSRLAVVRQDPFIFNNTLRYNLTIGNKDVEQEEIDNIAKIAKIDEFFDDLPNGYATQLGDEGVRLSGGQRQRVAIARALLKDADILILDEATSDLDSNLEEEVQESIENMERDYGIIAIAHRLSTVRNADCIYSMDSGEIIQSGKHTELMDIGGSYAELYDTQ